MVKTSVQKGIDYLTGNDLDRALKFFKKSFCDDAGSHLNLSAVYLRMNKHSDALKHAKRALELYEGDWDLAFSNIGLYYHRLNDPVNAIPWLTKAHNLGYADGSFNLALNHIKLGFKDPEHWKTGWELFEYRFKRSHPVSVSATRVPRWDGKSPGKVLVLAEQGYGDLFNFSRYCKLFDHDLQVFPETLEMMQRTGLNCVIDSMSSDADWHIPIMSLVGLFGWEVEGKLLDSSEGEGVGICWEGSKKHVNDNNRSSTERNFRYWFGKKATSLMYGHNKSIKTWEDTLRVVDSVKVVVTVDTSIAHIAGMLGKPCIVLLPTYDTDWRWGLAGKDGLHTNYWYKNMWLVANMNFELAKEILEDVNNKQI